VKRREFITLLGGGPRAPGKRERRDGRSAAVLSGSSTPTPLGPQLGAGGNAERLASLSARCGRSIVKGARSRLQANRLGEQASQEMQL
jgi:hypothetical protein